MPIDMSYLFEDMKNAIIHSNPLGATTLSRVRKWIELCQDYHNNSKNKKSSDYDKRHSSCRGTEIPKLPTRVLDVGTSEASHAVYLIETQGRHGEYIALSHCWGNSKSFLTTHETYEDMQDGFLPEHAPATFRDAINVTRVLGIRYLWIDSLCIIQGDLKDWERESSRMGGVYRDAFLTIAASSASSDEEGFLKPRPPARSALKLFSPTESSTVKLYITDRIKENDKEPLSERGWTLQEAYLSRRRLKFFESRIVFACQGAVKKEDVCCDAHDVFYPAGSPDSLQTLSPFWDENAYPQDKGWYKFPPYKGWYRMIREYSQRRLSFHSDRLPALSGLATLTARHVNGTYVAGIWWEDAAFGLCWSKNTREGKPLTKPDSYIAPSWSWASVMGAVEFPRVSDSSCDVFPLKMVTFKDYRLDYRGYDTFGQVNSGWMRIQAPLASFASMTLIKDRYARTKSFAISGIQHIRVGAVAGFDFDEKELEDLRLLFLLREEWDTEEGAHRDGIQLYGIVIKVEKEISPEICEAVPVQFQNNHVYKRVGFFWLEHWSDYYETVGVLEYLVTEVVLV